MNVHGCAQGAIAAPIESEEFDILYNSKNSDSGGELTYQENGQL